jgi:hypothetical protein
MSEIPQPRTGCLHPPGDRKCEFCVPGFWDRIKTAYDTYHSLYVDEQWCFDPRTETLLFDMWLNRIEAVLVEFDALGLDIGNQCPEPS